MKKKELKSAQDLNEHYQEKLDLVSSGKSGKQRYKSLLNEYEDLKEEYEKLTNNNPSNNGGSSKSLILSESDFDTITSLLTSGGLRYELLYRATEDGFEPEIFHQKCDSASMSLTVIKTGKGQVICGFTSQSWDGAGFKSDRHAFLVNLTQKRKFAIKDIANAIYTNQDIFPVFGDGDLIIGEDALSNLPQSYGEAGLDEEGALLGGVTKDYLSEMEVFAVLQF